MKKIRFLIKITSLVLAFAALLSAFSVFANGEESESYDYSLSGSQYTKTLTSADILEEVLGRDLGSAEKSYLINHGNTEIKYDEGITTSYVQASYNSGLLELSASEYEYTASSGAKIVWIPTRVELLGNSLALEKGDDGFYSARFENVPGEDESLAAVVTYKLDLTVSDEVLNDLLNQAYNDAPEWEALIAEKEAEYTAAHEQYVAAKAEYDAYIAAYDKYTDDLIAYNEYVIKKRAYDNALKKYNDYLADLALYNSQLAAHNKYLEDKVAYDAAYKEYSNYLNAYEAYKKEMESQQSYIETLDLCRSHLAIIESTKKETTSLKRTLYSDIVTNSLVDTILAERDLFESNGVGAPPKVLDLAGDSTEQLRILLKDYFSLKTESAKYNYYVNNYSAFVSGFTGLFQALEYLARNETITLAIDKSSGERRLDKFRILIANLYVITAALTDGNVKTVPAALINNDSKYKQETVTLSSLRIAYRKYDRVMGTEVLVEDTNNAKPVTTGFPPIVDLPKEPAKVDPPKPLVYVAKPDPVEEVVHPGDAPASVENPGAEPEVVEEPTEPEKFHTPPEVSAIIAARGESIVERTELFTEPQTITVESKVNKRFINVSTVDIGFYDTDGTPLKHITVDSGTPAVYSGTIPYKAEDARAVYTFSGWQTAEGVRVDISSVTENLHLYPYFSEKIKSYTVIWDMNGKITKETLPYGTLPSYTGEIYKAPTSTKKYVFSGWSPEVTEVTGNAEYVATFREDDIISIAPGVTVTFDGVTYLIDATSSFVSRFNIEDILADLSGGCDVYITTVAANIAISPEALAELKKVGACEISIGVLSSGSGIRHYTVTAYGSEGTQISCDTIVTVRANIKPDAADRLRVRYVDGEGVSNNVRYTLGEEGITFSAVLGPKYSIGYERLVNPVSSDFATITVKNETCYKGDTVSVNIDLPEGKRLVSLYYINEEGVKTIIYGSTFKMPDGDITIMASVEEIMYTVTFMNEGSVLMSYSLAHGKTPTPPAENPKKAGDGSFTYTFVGWSQEMSPITGDTVYTALYESTPVPPKVESDDLTIYETLVIIVTVVVAALGVIIVLIVLSFIFRGGRKVIPRVRIFRR